MILGRSVRFKSTFNGNIIKLDKRKYGVGWQSMRNTFLKGNEEPARHTTDNMTDKIMEFDVSGFSKKVVPSRFPDQETGIVPENEGASGGVDVPVSKVKKLENGIKVVTVDSVSQMSTVSVHFAGSYVSENSSNNGVSLLYERMAFKSTSTRDTVELCDELDALGGNYSVESGMDNIEIFIETFHHLIPKAVELISDIVKNQTFYAEDVENEIDSLIQESEEAKESIGMYVQQIATSASLGGQLSFNLIQLGDKLEHLNLEILEDFVKKTFVPSNMVIIGTGVNEEEFNNVVNQYFGDIPNTTPAVEVPKLPFYPSQWSFNINEYAPDDDNEYVALSFPSPGPLDMENFPVVCLLTYLFGRGDSFSSGGPGKGIHNRCTRRLVVCYPGIETAMSYFGGYYSSGIFGIYISMKHGADLKAKAICDEMIKFLNDAHNDKNFYVEFQRSINMLKFNIWRELERREQLSAEYAGQALFSGKIVPAEEVMKIIDNIAISDVIRVFTDIISSKPSIVTIGNEETLSKMKSGDHYHKYITTQLKKYKLDF